MKQELIGQIYHRIEKLGGFNYAHIGFEDDEGRFGNILAGLVSKLGMTRRVRVVFKFLD